MFVIRSIIKQLFYASVDSDVPTTAAKTSAQLVIGVAALPSLLLVKLKTKIKFLGVPKEDCTDSCSPAVF